MLDFQDDYSTLIATFEDFILLVVTIAATGLGYLFSRSRITAS